MIEPLPCPFCGNPPTVGPARPEIDGNAWGEVRCVNDDCPAQPVVFDGDKVADSRGTDAYKQAAIARWNRRAVPKLVADIAAVIKAAPDDSGWTDDAAVVRNRNNTISAIENILGRPRSAQ